MTTLRLSPVFIALSLTSTFALAAPVGTVLFARGDVQIIDVKGKPRPAVRGAELQDGERIVAPPGAASQIKMIDGSLFGVRPDTEFKVELPAQASEKAKQTISLIRGGLRVINADMRDGKKREPITLQTGASVVQLVNGDMESFFVRPDSKTRGSTETGSYTRLITGTGSVRSGSFVAPLAIQTIAFVPKTDVAPVTTTTVAPTMFITPTFTTSLSTLSTTTSTSTATTTISPTLATSTISPTLTTSTISPTLTTSTISPTLSTSTTSLTTTFSPTTSTLTSPTLLTSTSLISPTTSTYIAPTTTLNTSTLSTTTLTTSPTLALTSPTITTTTYKPPPTITYVPPPPTTVTCKTCSTLIIKR
jgi:hypothetical protein